MIYILDAKHHWENDIFDAAQRAGMNARLVGSPNISGSGYGFVRPSPDPQILPIHRAHYRTMANTLKMIQDQDQIDLYEDKSAQFAKYYEWMPDTWRFTDMDAAVSFVMNASYPLISKSNEGSSSRNVRVLANVDDALNDVFKAFAGGIEVDYGRRKGKQKGYVLLQRFIPHRLTYRVNAIGNARAIFLRYCHPDRPVAQTGNVEPCVKLDDEMNSLLEWSDRFFKFAGTNWCAIDVLKDGEKWALLETGLAWPWPSPGTCNDGPIFRSKHKWIGMFDVMMDEIKAGTFG